MTSGQVSLGIDVGYRLPTQSLFLEFALGASVGYGWNVMDYVPSVYTSLWSRPSGGSSSRVVWDINPNLLRVGGRFLNP